MPASETSARLVAAPQRLEHGRPHPVGVVVVIRLERLSIPNRASRRAVTRVSSHKMRSTLRNTQSAAQRDVAEIADRRRDDMQPGRQLMLRRPVGGIGLRRQARKLHPAGFTCPMGLLAAVRWLGSAPALAPCRRPLLRCWRFPRFASTLLAFALLLALAACGGRRWYRHRSARAAIPVGRRPPRAAGAGGRAGDSRCRRPARSRSALLVPLSGRQCRARQGDARRGAIGAVRDRQRPADVGAARHAAAPPKARRAPRARRSPTGATLILGPLLAPEVEAVKPVAREANVNVIAFSTVTHLAGGNVFLMGFLPRQEVVREVAYARASVASDRFAALAPELALRPVDGRGAAGSGAPRPAAPSTRSSFSIRAAPTFRRRSSARAGGAAEDSARRLRRLRVPAFDALLLPEGGAQLKQLARQLKEAGGRTASGALARQRLVGRPRHRQRAGARRRLVRRVAAGSAARIRAPVQTTYGHARRASPRSASMPRRSPRCWRSAAGREPFSQEAILNPSGFTGVDGLFRFTPQGLVQRGLAVLEADAARQRRRQSRRPATSRIFVYLSWFMA